jgi:hypothetical protein
MNGGEEIREHFHQWMLLYRIEMHLPTFDAHRQREREAL